jgi:hypothetical protein
MCCTRHVPQLSRPVLLQGPTDVFVLGVFEGEAVERHEAGAPENRAAQSLGLVKLVLSDVEAPLGAHCHDQPSDRVLVLGGYQPAPPGIIKNPNIGLTKHHAKTSGNTARGRKTSCECLSVLRKMTLTRAY